MVDAEARTLLRSIRGPGTSSHGDGGDPMDVAPAPGGVWVTNAAPKAREFTARSGGRARSSGSILRRQQPAARAWRCRPSERRTRPATTSWRVGGTRCGRSPPTDGRARSIPRPADRGTNATRAGACDRSPPGGAGVWVLAGRRRARQLDERTGQVVRRCGLRMPPAALAVGDDAAWVTSAGDGKLWRVGAGAGSVPGSVDVGSGHTDVVATRRGVWIARTRSPGR